MDPLRNFGFLLKDVSRLSTKNFERHSAEAHLGLTLEQCRVLVSIERNPGITQSCLALFADIDPMTLVRMLDRMEQDGWVERRPDPGDRRVRRLHLKTAGAAIVERIDEVGDRARAQSLAGLDAADRNRLLALLERIHGNLAALIPGALDLAQRRESVAPAAVAKMRRMAVRTVVRTSRKSAT